MRAEVIQAGVYSDFIQSEAVMNHTKVPASKRAFIISEQIVSVK